VRELPNLPFLTPASIPSQSKDRLKLTTIFAILKLDVKRSVHTFGTFLQVAVPGFWEGGALLRLLRLHLPSRVGVGSAY